MIKQKTREKKSTFETFEELTDPKMPTIPTRRVGRRSSCDMKVCSMLGIKNPFERTNLMDIVNV